MSTPVVALKMTYDIPVLTDFKQTSIVIKVEEPKPKEPKLYTIKSGDNLTKIANAHSVDLSRLWAANPELTNPDLIEPEKPLKIPQADEVLPERALPVSEVSITTDNSSFVKPRNSVPSGRSSVSRSGNTYEPGQCVWHVKNLKPELPNNLGNADTWYARATAQGMATGTEAAVGAAGVRKAGMHAVYVTAVHGDGTITISEMNYNYIPYSTRTRVANASDFYYIY